MVKLGFFLNSFLAVSLDQTNQKEQIIYSVGYADEFFSGIRKKYTSEQRELGEMIFDFSCDIETYMFESRNNIICEYIDEYKRMISNNTINWQCDSELCKIHDMFDLQLEFVNSSLINESFFETQKRIKLDGNHRYSSAYMLDALNRKYNFYNKLKIMYIDNSPYIVTDFDFVGLLRYYLDELYNVGLFPRQCMRCNKMFLSKKKHGNVLCSPQCQKISNAHNSKKYYQKMDDNDKLYYNLYHKWKQRINKIRENNIVSQDVIDDLNEELLQLTEINKIRVSERKKGNVPEADGVPNYHSFDEHYRELFDKQDKNMYSILNRARK